MGKISKLPNIGPVIEQQLEQVGITTAEQLKEIGAEQAWLRIQGIDECACIHRLFGLEGAIRGIRKKQLGEERKEELREFYRWHKKQ